MPGGHAATSSPMNQALVKTITFALLHFGVAFSVTYLGAS
jgi:hypothetical protein